MSNDALVLLAALSSIQLSKGLTAEQIGLMAAFFTCLGDNMAQLALQSASEGEQIFTTPPNG